MSFRKQIGNALDKSMKDKVNEFSTRLNEFADAINTLQEGMKTLEKHLITIQENQCEQEDFFKILQKYFKKILNKK